MSLLRAPVNSSDHVQGPDNAPVTLLEYGDYQCPHCGAAHPVVQRVQRYFSSRLRLAYRHFPLTEIHEFAEAAAETAEYAGFYGRFWEAHDMLFENQNRLDRHSLLAYAKALGLDPEQFKEDIDDPVVAAKIEASFESGVRSGVNGTPCLFLNGERYDGPRDANSLIQLMRG